MQFYYMKRRNKGNQKTAGRAEKTFSKSLIIHEVYTKELVTLYVFGYLIFHFSVFFSL